MNIKKLGEIIGLGFGLILSLTFLAALGIGCFKLLIWLVSL